MLAIILCLALFAYLSVVGYAVLALLSDEEPLYLLLLAPVTGAAVVILLTFTGNQFGVPIRYFAHALVALVLAAALIVLWRRGRRIKIRDLWPYLLLICLGLFMTGWPMLRFGLDWVSFCNDDMANYCMGTERLLRHGYFQPPNAMAMAGLDYTQITWFLHVFHRPGSEMMLGLVSAITGIVSLRIFMPVILAFTLCQISAAGAMTYAASRSRLATWIVLGLMSMSALVGLGTLYQLIAQVIGLALAAGLTSVLLRSADDTPRKRPFARGALIGLLLAGLIVSYTEALPFVALGYFLYAALVIRGGWAAWRRVLIVLGIAALAVFVFLNRFVPISVLYVLAQAHNTAPENPAATMFPYYMMPSGPVFFWGLFAIGQSFPSDKLFSALIVGAIALCLGSALLVFRSLHRRHAPAFVCVVMSAMFVFLFHNHAGFGMYKLAMYLQPFFLATIVLGWLSLWRNRIVQVVPLVLIGLANISSHLFYTQMSLGSGRVFNEISEASSTHLVREYADLMKRNPGRPLELDTFNIVLAKFQMTESIGRPQTFPSNRFLGNLSVGELHPLLVGRKNAAEGLAVAEAYVADFQKRRFQLHPPAGSTGPSVNEFLLSLAGRDAVANADTPEHPLLLVGTTGRQAPFNRSQDPEQAEHNFRAGGLDQFQNHLVFIASRLGEPYFVAGREHVAIYQLEPDVVFANRTMAGVGQYLLFRVVNPSSGCRLKLEMTDTFAANGKNRLPPAAAIGDTRMAFPITGRGSARVFSPPLAPQIIHGQPFVAIDMGIAGDFINYAPGGLMRMWGRSVHLDRRQIVGFLRDISLVSDAQYQALRPPAIIERFPDDLAQPALEYSGLYEDGYVGDRAFVSLTPPPGFSLLVARGVVPQVNDPGFTTEAILSVDGHEVVRKTLPVADFELTALVPPASRRKVELSFSRLQVLPGNDQRPVGAHLSQLGFVAAPSSVSWSADTLMRHSLRYTGMWDDGWMGADVSMRLVQPAGATRLVVRGQIPRITDASFTTSVALSIDGKQLATKSCGIDDFEISADLPAGAADRKIELSFSKLQQLPAPDSRTVSAQFKSISFERPNAVGPR